MSKIVLEGMSTETIFQQFATLPQEAKIEALDFMKELLEKYKVKTQKVSKDAEIQKRLEILENSAGTINVPVNPNETYDRESIYDDDGR